MAGKAQPFNLLRTKLYRPRATGDLIRRPRVRDILERSVEQALTLVSAPAGFGKTTLLSDWLSTSPHPGAWLSLDEGDSDLRVFLRYLTAGVRTVYPDALANTLARVQAPVLPPLDSLVTTVANDLDRLADDTRAPAGQRLILVLDDYHHVQGPEVHTLLGELLRHPPRGVHLIISTRHDPPIPLHALRARGELSDIRVRELRFTPAEIATFMEQTVGAPLDSQAVDTLAERTEGWVTGLRLAALALTAGGDVASPELAVDNRYVLDYLLNEVLAHIPVATHDFLLKTSILPRLSGPLCDAVAGPAGVQWDGRAYLKWLAAQNLFTFSLDAQGNWYRYHQLFQKLLRSQLERLADADEIAALHGRASAWFAENALIDEAIEHALAAGDEDLVVQLVQDHRHDVMNREHFGQLEHWLSLMPPRLVNSRPELMMLEAWALHGRFRLSDLAKRVEEIAAAIEQVNPPLAVARDLRGEIDALRCQVAYWSTDPARTLELALSALSTLPPKCIYARAAALTYYLGALQMQGRLQAGVAVIEDALQDDRLHGSAAQGRLLMILCAAYWMEGDISALLQVSNRLLTFARDANLPDSLTRAHFYLGCAHYVIDDLAAAERHFAFVLDHRHEAYALIVMQSGFGLASVYQAQGLPERARSALALVVDHAVAMDNQDMLRDAEAYAAHLALRQSRRADAERWAARADHRIHTPAMPVFYASPFALVEVLLANGARASLEKAARLVAELREAVRRNHNTRFFVEALALEALLHSARGDQAAARVALMQAVSLAEYGGLVRVFVDHGPEMAALLQQLADQNAGSEQVDTLLRAFGDAPRRLSRNTQFAQAALTLGRTDGVNTAPPGTKLHATGQPGLIEPLSERELEVLALLNQRLSNKEIAQELCISPTTVKRHTVNIYQKLSVGGRREAVARAVELDLVLAPPRRPIG